MKYLACLCILLGLNAAARAEDVLFIGNSFTRSVPKVVEAIAKANGKTLTTGEVVKGGQNWGYHLAQPATSKAIGEKQWDAVVLQDYSSEPTRIGKVDKFMADGETFYRKIRAASPKATVVLYQTWALDEDNPIFAKEPTTKKFASPEEMTADLIKNYAALAKKLEEIEAGEQVRVAPVGEAFAKCIATHPDIDMMGKDNKHPTDTGRYLSSLVIYATLFNTSPIGEVPSTVKVKPDVAKVLQQIADDVTKASRTPADKAK